MSEAVYGRTFSAAEFDLLPRPTCPVCGSTMDLDRIDVTWNAEQEAREGRRYIIGMHQCPHDCNPVTGERFHGDIEISTVIPDGYDFRCSCDVEERGVTGERIDQLLQREHPPGQYTK